MKKGEKLQLQVELEEFCSTVPKAQFHHAISENLRVDSPTEEIFFNCFTDLMGILKNASVNEIDVQLTVTAASILLTVRNYEVAFDPGTVFYSDLFGEIRDKISVYNETALYKCKIDTIKVTQGAAIEFRVITVDVHITEDQPVVADGFELFLRKEGFNVIGVSNTLEDCRNVLKHKKTDILLLDINMRRKPEGGAIQGNDDNGMIFCKEVTKDYPVIKVIAYTFYKEFSIIRRMLDNGASGYITKDSEPDEFIRGIVAVVNGEQFLSSDIRDVMENKDDLLPEAEQTRLTHREVEVLELIAEGFIVKEIAEKLGLAVSTVSTISKNIKEKYNHYTFTKIVLLAMIDGKISLKGVEMRKLAFSALKYGNVILDEREMKTLSELISDYVITDKEKEQSEKKQELLSILEKSKVKFSDAEKKQILAAIEKTEERIDDN